MRLFRKIRTWFLFELRPRLQRFRRGYAYGDIWDMDAWFIRTVEPMLRHLQKHHWGYPHGFADVQTDEDWTKILGEMADALHLMDEGNVLEQPGCEDLEYDKIQKITEENKARFFELFSRYFYCLWD